MARRRNVTAEKKAAFLIAYTERGSIYHGAQAADISRRTVYRWRDADPDFAAAMDDAKEDAADALEESLYQRGKERDTVAAIFWLKGARPDKYRDRADTTHRGDPAAPLRVQITDVVMAFPPEEDSHGRGD